MRDWTQVVGLLAMMSTACGSTVIAGGDGATGTGGAGAGDGMGGTATGVEEPDPCASCASGEICTPFGCTPEVLVKLYVHQRPTGVTAHAMMHRWVEDANYAAVPMGDHCTRVEAPATAPGYMPMPLALGTVELVVDGGLQFQFPPPGPANDSTYVDVVALGFSPLAHHEFQISWTGSAEVPAGSATFASPKPFTVNPPAPVIGGEPWTVTWDPPGDVWSAVAGNILCRMATNPGTSLTLPPEVTSWVVDQPPDEVFIGLEAIGPRGDHALTPDGRIGVSADCSRIEDIPIPFP